jgi:hypothetical protein
VTTSFIAVPHLEHERGLALGFVATHAPCARSVGRVFLDANALYVTWFGTVARNPRPPEGIASVLVEAKLGETSRSSRAWRAVNAA